MTPGPLRITIPPKSSQEVRSALSSEQSLDFAFALVDRRPRKANVATIRKEMGFPAMMRSMLSLLLILIGIPLIAAALHGDTTFIETRDARLHGLYAGVVLIIAGFIIGKFWSLKWDYKGSGARAEAAAAASAAATQKRQEPVEEQIDLFEPQQKA